MTRVAPPHARALDGGAQRSRSILVEADNLSQITGALTVREGRGHPRRRGMERKRQDPRKSGHDLHDLVAETVSAARATRALGVSVCQTASGGHKFTNFDSHEIARRMRTQRTQRDCVARRRAQNCGLVDQSQPEAGQKIAKNAGHLGRRTYNKINHNANVIEE